MTQLTRINPQTLAPPPDNLHAHIVVTPPGARLAFIAGQVALDRDLNIVGGRDHYEQAVQCFTNIRHALAALSVGTDMIAQMTILVVDHSHTVFERINAAGAAVFGSQWPVTATTLIGAAALGHAAFLIEVNAVVALV